MLNRATIAQCKTVRRRQPAMVVLLFNKYNQGVETMEEKKKAKDGAVYVREQKGHSLVLHLFLLLFGIGLITIPYISLSKRHYWHA